MSLSDADLLSYFISGSNDAKLYLSDPTVDPFLAYIADLLEAGRPGPAPASRKSDYQFKTKAGMIESVAELSRNNYLKAYEQAATANLAAQVDWLECLSALLSSYCLYFSGKTNDALRSISYSAASTQSHDFSLRKDIASANKMLELIIILESELSSEALQRSIDVAVDYLIVNGCHGNTHRLALLHYLAAAIRSEATEPSLLERQRVRKYYTSIAGIYSLELELVLQALDMLLSSRVSAETAS